MKRAHFQVAAPRAKVPITQAPAPTPRWWEAPELLALAALRRAMMGGAPALAPVTAEESARHAVFWLLFEMEHLVRRFAARLEAGQAVRVRCGVYRREDGGVDFNLRIVEEPEVTIAVPSPRGAP